MTNQDELETLEVAQALDELDDDAERYVGTVLDDRSNHSSYSGRMRKKHLPRERDAELEDPGEWVGVFRRDGGLY